MDPGIDGVSRGAPAERVSYMILDLSHPAETVFQHSFIPFWIQSFGARLEPHRFFQRSNLRLRRKRIGQIDRRTRLGPRLNCFRNSAEVFEVMIDVSNADFE